MTISIALDAVSATSLHPCYHRTGLGSTLRPEFILTGLRAHTFKYREVNRANLKRTFNHRNQLWVYAF
jgi:hypothetical protein